MRKNWDYRFVTSLYLAVALIACLVVAEATGQDLSSLDDPDAAYLTLPQPIEVTVTIYHAVIGQTDSTPHILADGTKIDIKRAGSYRYCALSRDLLERWGGEFAYGDTIYIDNIGKFSGAWIVKDTMNKRWTKRVDLLLDGGSKLYKWETASMNRVDNGIF